MKKIVGSLAVSFILLASVASAAPIYGIGNECPTDAQMLAEPDYTRQYYVTQALVCVFDPDVNNITGTDDEADLYLNLLGGGWVGLGEGDDVDFAYTADAGNDDGTFLILSPAPYNQFAIGVKDGSNPFFAIFVLPTNVLAGNWGFSTEGGDLSHFAIYGHTGTVVINPNCLFPPCSDPPAVPEPASMLLLGTGLLFGARAKYRRVRK